MHFLGTAITRFTLAGLGAAALLLWALLRPLEFEALQARLRWRLHPLMPLPAAEQLSHEAWLTAVQLRGEAALPAGATLIFGDSHLQSLAALPCPAAAWANFAIAGEPAQRLALRMARYTSLKQAGLVILLSGSNDLAQGASPEQAVFWVAQALSTLEKDTPLLLLALPPASQAEPITQALAELAAEPRLRLNRRLAALCAERAACRFVPLGALANDQARLRPEFAAADGVHLSTAGYRQLGQLLLQAMPPAAQCKRPANPTPP